MSDAILALRTAIHSCLASDAALSALIGPDRIFEQPPRATTGLYVVHGEIEARDWSTGDSTGSELDVALAIWAAEPASPRTALEAAGVIAAALDGHDLPLQGHRLVLLRWVSTRLARDQRSNLPVVRLRLRALTETL